MPKHQFDVEVLPEYLPEQSAPDTGVFSFAYTITITNAGDAPGQLISRHWIIRCTSIGTAAPAGVLAWGFRAWQTMGPNVRLGT